MSPSPSADHAVKDAIVHHKAGRLEDAERLYRAALTLEPDHPEAHHNLGVVTVQRGQVAASLDHFQRALDGAPDQSLYWLSYARALLGTGHKDKAKEILHQAGQRGVAGPAFDALAAQAGLATAGAGDFDTVYGAAIAQHQAGRLEEAAALYRKAISVAPERLEAHDNLGTVLGSLGKPEQAAEIFRQALTHAPDNPDLFFNLGNALTSAGKSAEAIEAYRRAIAIKPDHAEAHYHLGSLLSENGRIAEGFQHLMQRAALVYGTGKAPPKDAPDPPHKIKHDREQREYLGDRAPAGAVDDLFHLGDGGRLAGPAVNPANATPALLETWRTAWPQMVVMENFLTPEALEKLRAYCAESTIWRRIYSAGYIGATPPDGFACPLLAQIAEEITTTWPEIFAAHHFAYLGAFKYDSELSTGTNTHADFSAVNVNFYIAPDAANNDPDHGGMEIWDVSTDDEAEMRRFNSNETAIREHLKRKGAKSTIVPHRANRCVIFKSSMIHKTDDCDFIEGYRNKRINVSLLFGKLGAPTK